MGMKTKFIATISTSCFYIIFLVSCASHEQKTDDAFEHFKEKKMMSKDSGGVSKEIIPDTSKTTPDKKTE